MQCTYNSESEVVILHFRSSEKELSKFYIDILKNFGKEDLSKFKKKYCHSKHCRCFDLYVRADSGAAIRFTSALIQASQIIESNKNYMQIVSFIAIINPKYICVKYN